MFHHRPRHRTRHRACHRALRLLLSATVAGTAFPLFLAAQGRGAAARTVTPVNESADPLLRQFTFRPIGPAVMMGRVDDITGPDNDAMVMYAGFATGGVWKTQDGGAHWRPVFDQQPNQSIGAIGVAATNANIVYVGTGEANNRQSSTIGDGIWGSTDGGEHWTHLGLENTQTIGRIVVDPTNPNVVYVAAVGHLFGPNEDRGLTRPPTAARRGRRRSTSTRTRASPTSPSTPSIRKCCTRLHMNAGVPGSASTAVAPAARSGRRPTPARLGKSSTARGGPSRRTASMAAWRSRSSAR